jgi:hypothetical protein
MRIVEVRYDGEFIKLSLILRIVKYKSLIILFCDNFIVFFYPYQFFIILKSQFFCFY